MPAIPATHPSSEQLSAFALGKLESDVFDVLESHLADCETCCDAIKQMKEDTFVGLVRQMRDKVVPAGDATIATADHSGPRIEVAADSPPEIPADLAHHARYRIVDLLGTGGMGAVYKAEHRLMQRLVALKVINPKFTLSAQAVERFRREAQAAARLDHPNIVRAHDAEQAGDLHFLVMEYVPGTDLGKVLDERGPLPVAEACEYVRQAALGLQHAHESGMVHRDIKPQNLMLSGGESTRTPTVKILDFGLASLTTATAGDATESDCDSIDDAQAPGLTQAGSLMGTPDYMAPEQGRDARSADIRSDIYSLGCTLYALLVGKVPFPGGTAIDKINSHAKSAAQPLRELRPDVPVAVVDVVEKMMAKDPANRYQTPKDVAEALGAINRLRDRSRNERGPRRWQTGLAVSAAAAFLAVVVSGIVFFWSTPDGVVRFEIDDPDIKVVIDKDGPKITGADKEPITLKPGKHGLTITRGTDFTFDTTTFEMKRGGTSKLKIDWLPGDKMIVLHDGRQIAAAARPKTVAAVPDDKKELPPSTAPQPKFDPASILGEWTPISAEAFGQPASQALVDLMNPRLMFAPDKLTVKLDYDKMPIPVDAIKRLLRSFDDKEKALTPKELDAVFEKKGIEAVYTHDTTKSPRTINISYLSPIRKTLLGIYKIEGDTLKLCVTVDPDKAEHRPTEFAAGIGQSYVILKRAPAE